MLRKKRTYILLAVLWLFAVICVIATARSFHKSFGLPAEAPGDSAYILRVNGDYVAVYEAGSPSIPVEITDIPVRELRQHDQELLRTGLGAENREALLLLLEDLRA